MIGESELDDAVKMLEELKSNDMASNREIYMLAKIKHKQGLKEESHQYFVEFLEQSKWSADHFDCSRNSTKY